MKLASKLVLESDADCDWMTMPNEERARGGRRGLQPQEMKIGSSTAWLMWAHIHSSTPVSGAFAIAGTLFSAVACCGQLGSPSSMINFSRSHFIFINCFIDQNVVLTCA